MSFDDAMFEVLQGRRYDILMGRRVDIQRVIAAWFERLIISILERIHLGDFEGISRERLGIIATIFAMIGVVIIVVAVVVLFRLLRRSRQNMVHDLSDIFEELSRRSYTVDELLQLSQSAQDRRLAVRYRYIAALLALNERDIIRISPSATNRLILREIQSAAPGLVSAFSQVVDVFHLVWFGHKQVSDEVFIKFAHAIHTLIEDNQ